MTKFQQALAVVSDVYYQGVKDHGDQTKDSREDYLVQMNVMIMEILAEN
jgi:hypothetical protein